MLQYQTLLFGCPNPPVGLDDRDDLELIETTWDWIAQMADHHPILDWPADTVVIASLPGEQAEADDVLGVVIACSHPDARHYPRPVTPLFDLLPKDAGAQILAELCLPLAEDIQ